MSLEPAGRNSTWMVPIGILSGLIGAGAAVVGLLLAAFSTNACGAFADGCDDYGEPAASFLPAVAVTVLGGVAFIVGLVLVVAGMSKSPNRRGELRWEDGSGDPSVG